MKALLRDIRTIDGLAFSVGGLIVWLLYIAVTP